MTTEEILDLLAHPGFIRLEQRKKDWSITYTGATGRERTIYGGTLDDLLVSFANIVEEHGVEG